MKKLIIVFLLFVNNIYSQTDTPCGAPILSVNTSCINTTGTTIGSTQSTTIADGGTPTCGLMGPDVWYSFVAPTSGSVVITTTAGTITDGCMALYQGACGSLTQMACSDDVIGLMPQISQAGLTPGTTYYIRVWKYGGGTGTFSICITLGNNTNCNTQTPICSGSPISFTANTGGTPASTVNPGNNYGCLFTTPNPSWYYLQIATGGNLVVDITAGSDVDFAIWGPFASQAAGNAACNTYSAPLDCSYSIAAVEQVNVAGVIPGQVYVLLVTNYANTVQTINVTNAGGTATTNCTIINLPVELLYFEGDNYEVGNIIKWKTETENNSDYFNLEWTTNPVDGTWVNIKKIESCGNCGSLYGYVHNTFKRETINYYRLSQVDNDGKVTFYDPIAINNTSNKKEVLKVINTMGQTVDINTKGIVIIIYTDGKIERVFNN